MYILLHSLLVISTSCDLGSVNGNDPIGKWTLSSELYSEYFSFHDDNTGYYEKREKNDWIQKDFSWTIKEGSYYKIIKTRIGDFEYYFNTNKDKYTAYKQCLISVAKTE